MQPDTLDREGEQISKEMQLLEKSLDMPHQQNSFDKESKTRNLDSNTVKTKNLDESFS